MGFRSSCGWFGGGVGGGPAWSSVNVHTGISWGYCHIYIDFVVILETSRFVVFISRTFPLLPNHFDLINVDIQTRVGWGRLTPPCGPR